MSKKKPSRPRQPAAQAARARPAGPMRHRLARRVNDRAPVSGGAIVPGTDPCVCGGATEDHGRDPEYPGSTACTHCTDCFAYEADPQEDSP
jgi:hypothetical protein